MGDGFYRARFGGQEMAPGAVTPARPDSPPPPPPPASGATPVDWTRDPYGVRKPEPQAVAQRSTVDVTGAREALVVGPNDVLIVSFPEHVTVDELYEIRSRMLDSDLRPGQVLLVAGAEKFVKVEGDDGSRTYVRPSAVGRTGPVCDQCGARVESWGGYTDENGGGPVHAYPCGHAQGQRR